MTTPRLRIMVVEDFDDTREILVDLIRLHGHWVESCSDKATALARMSNDGFDVLLTDVRLPDGDAWTLLIDLAERGILPPRVISMSAFNAGEMRKKSAFFGCAGHLSKPFEMRDLEKLLG